jgi:hypothetical protein
MVRWVQLSFTVKGFGAAYLPGNGLHLTGLFGLSFIDIAIYLLCLALIGVTWRQIIAAWLKQLLEWCVSEVKNQLGLKNISLAARARLDATAVRCEFHVAWRKTRQRRRQATCSLTSRRLPPCNPSRGDWSVAERCLAPASARPRNHFSPRCCKQFSPSGQLSSSRRI